MDPSFVSLLSVFFILVLIKKLLLRPAAADHLSDSPPGPKPLPIIGNLHNLVGQLPHHAMRSLANTYGPLIRLRVGQVDFVVASSREAASEILKTHDVHFAGRPDNIIAARTIAYGNSTIVMSPYGEYWRQLRRICTDELLSAARVRSFSSVRRHEILKLADEIRASGPAPVNMSIKLSTLTSKIIADCAFGRNCEHSEAVIAALKDTIRLASGFCLADLFPDVKYLDVVTGLRYKINKVHRRLDRILQQIVDEHRVKRRMNPPPTTVQEKEDLADVLVRIKDSGDPNSPITKDNNIKALLLDMFAAGTETTPLAMEWAMAELIRHPKCMEKVQDELRRALEGKINIDDEDLNQLHYLKLVIKETLRLHPPGLFLVPRVCTKTSQVSGYKVEAGTRVLVNAWALGRDPRYWEDPESFVPERFENSCLHYNGVSFEYLPFGAGRRICPGMPFGLATVESTLAHLLLHFDWRLPEGMKAEDLDMTERFGITAVRNSPLYLVATPYLLKTHLIMP